MREKKQLQFQYKWRKKGNKIVYGLQLSNHIPRHDEKAKYINKAIFFETNNLGKFIQENHGYMDVIKNPVIYSSFVITVMAIFWSLPIEYI